MFAAAAVQLAGLAARALGWRPQEFWAATPAELAQSLGTLALGETPPSRAEILNLIERDHHDRSR